MTDGHQEKPAYDEFCKNLSFTISKPLWLSHTDDKNKRKSILCLDLHPQVPLLATGCIDSTVKLWNVTDSTNENSCVSMLTRHSGAILSLKWSTNGRFLASGSDDCMVVIWHSTDNGPFTAFKILTNHTSDVTDIVWTTTALITCGVDNMIYVFDLQKFTVLAKVSLASVAKGLCVDPFGAFIACQLENSIVFVRTSDWSLEKSVPKIAQDYSGSFFSRPSWCPDGSLIAASGGYSQSTGSSCWLFQRDTWLVDGCLIGHQGSVECSKFSPTLYSLKSNSSTKIEHCFGLIALGSQDGSISLWSNVDEKPLLVLWDAFSHSALDICWNQEGNRFFACSFDGCVLDVSIKFTGNIESLKMERIHTMVSSTMEQSDLLPSTENELSLKAMAKDKRFIISSLNNSSVFPSSQNAASTINLKTLTENTSGSQGLISSTATSLTEDSLETLREQRVQKTKDGKKRITPQFLKPIDIFTEEQQAPISSSIKKSIIADFDLSLYPAVTSDENQKREILKKYSSSYLPELITKILSPSSTIHKSLAGYDFSMQIQQTPKIATSKITMQRNERILWNDNISVKSILYADFNQNYTVLCGDDLILIVYSTMTGRKLLPKVFLPNSPHFISLNSTLFTVIFIDGNVFVWDLQEKRLFLKTSIQPFLKNSNVSVLAVDFHLNENSILLKLNNCTSLSYNYKTLQIWSIPLKSGKFSLFNSSLLPSLSTSFTSASAFSEEVSEILHQSTASIIQQSLTDIEEKLSATLITSDFALYKTHCIAYLNLLCTSNSNESLEKVREIIDEVVYLHKKHSDVLFKKETVNEIFSVILYYGKLRREIEEILYLLK